MGEYYAVFNLDKKELIHPSGFHHGNKPGDMIEHARGGLLHGMLELLLMGGSIRAERERSGHLVGRWAGDRIAVIGDYFEEDFGGFHWSNDETTGRWAGRAGWADISEHVARAIGTEPNSDWVGMSVMHADGTAVSTSLYGE